MTLSPAIQKMIRVFTISKPYMLSYEYRTKRGKEAHDNDLPVLKEMIEKGLVVRIEKTQKTILYKYQSKEAAQP